MREDLCSIPINDIFGEKDGCPVCRLYKTLENRMIDYTLGSAMMEPDVRIMTNQKGFCDRHYSLLFEDGKRLPLALILKTHMAEFDLTDGKKLFEKAQSAKDKCFVCDGIEWGYSRLINQIYHMYEENAEFRESFNLQPQFCLKHYAELYKNSGKKVMKKHYKEFRQNLFEITLKSIKHLENQLDLFTRMYDYNSDKNSEEFINSKTAIEETLKFLK